MTTYYIRQSGNDSNAGTSPVAAWRTLGKALGASGISSGDRVYQGPGHYYEYIDIGMTSAAAETFVTGDPSGAITGDAPGPVYNIGWAPYGWGVGDNNLEAVSMNGRSHLTFENMGFLGNYGVSEAAEGSQYVKFVNCFLYGDTDGALIYAQNQATPLHWRFERCMLFGDSDAWIVLTRSATSGSADVDVDVVFDHCFMAGGNTHSGYISNDTLDGSTWKQGGVDIIACTGIGRLEVTSNHSSSIPCTIQDSTIYGQTQSQTLGFLVDLGNNLFHASFTLTRHETSRGMTGLSGSSPLPFHLGQEEILWGLPSQLPFTPIFPGTNTGMTGTPTTDIGGRPSPDGGAKLYDTGTATAGAATTLTDSGKSWKVDQHKGRLVRIISGTGSGQIKRIGSNTATVLTIGTKSGDWATNPSTDSVYVIYSGTPAETGKATSGSDTTIVDSGAAWATNQWQGYIVAIGAENHLVLSNTSTTLTTASWTVDPTTNDLYSIYKSTSLTEQGRYPGAFQRHDSAEIDTVTVDGTGVSIHIDGIGSHEFQIPVAAGSFTISVRSRYDTNHATTNKPQVTLLASPELGITTETKTMTSAADTWETLTFTPQTATAGGVVTVRLVSRAAAPYGRAFFDSFVVV